MIKKIVVCDVCDTLFYSNTTFDFLQFVVSFQSPYRRLLFTVINGRWSPFFYALALASKLTEKDLVRRMSLFFLKGLTITEATSYANAFYDMYLSMRRINPVFDLIEKMRVDSKLILVSSSLEIIVKVIAERNGLPYLASELEIENGVITGVIIKELKSRKHLAIQPYLADYELTVISDNHSDWQLLEMANNRFVVIANERDKLFWEGLKPIFIMKR